MMPVSTPIFFYFFLTTLSALPPQLLQEVLPWRTFIWEERVTDLQFLQTNFPLNRRASASGNFAIMNTFILI